jgi:hypothetical protein
LSHFYRWSPPHWREKRGRKSPVIPSRCLRNVTIASCRIQICRNDVLFLSCPITGRNSFACSDSVRFSTGQQQQRSASGLLSPSKWLGHEMAFLSLFASAPSRCQSVGVQRAKTWLPNLVLRCTHVFLIQEWGDHWKWEETRGGDDWI